MSLTIRRVLKVFKNTDTKPFLVDASDGNEYILKHTAVRQDFLGLAKELVVSRLGRALGLPIPDFELIQIAVPSKTIFDSFCKKNDCISPGIGTWFASKAVPGAFNLFENPKKQIESRSIINQIDVGSGTGLDSLVHNADRNKGNVLFTQNTIPKGIKFYLIDHARCFGGIVFPPNSEITSTVELVNDLKYITSVKLTKLLYSYGSKTIEKIDDTMIDRIFADIPSSWKIQSTDISILKKFLKDRISKTKTLLDSK